MSVYKDEKTGKWYFRVRLYDLDGNFVKHSKGSGYELKREAVDAQKQCERTFKEQLEKLEKNPFEGVLFKDVAKHYLQVLKMNSKGEDGYKKALRTIEMHILPYFEDKLVIKILNKDVLDWQIGLKEAIYTLKNGQQQHYSITFLQDIHTYLSSIFKHGEKVFNTAHNPARAVGNFKRTEPPEEMKFWTIDQFKTFFLNIDDTMYKTIFAILFMLGLRKGEMRALKWNNINWEKGTISVKKTVHRDGTLGSPKTFSSIRTLKLDLFTMNLLKLLYKERRDIVGFNDNFFVVGKKGITPVSSTTLDRVYNKYCEMTDLERIRIHDFRHPYVKPAPKNNLRYSINS